MIIILVLASLALFAGCEEDRGTMPVEGPEPRAETINPELLAGELAEISGWETEKPFDTCDLPDFVTFIERTPVLGDVVHYSYILQVGPGEYDRIGLHRVVKEKRNGMPVRTRKNLFMLHGDGEAFESMFLPGTNTTLPAGFGLAVYLAQNDVDVWGMDQSWALVPAATTDFSFMAGWDLQHEVNNLRTGLSVARAARVLTSQGPGKMLLLGYSSGAATGYAYLNEETLYPELARNVCGFIPVDMPYKTDDPVVKGTLAAYATNFQGLIDSGVYKYDSAFGPVGMLASMDPEGDSPLAPGYTNLQVAIFLGIATYEFNPLTPTFHYLAAELDESGNPIGFAYLGLDPWLEFLQNAAPYEALPFMTEYAAVIGDAWELPYDDYLGDITVPVLFLGAAGGFGAYGEYTTTLLGSSDVTTMVIQLLPAGYEMIDYGHIDLFLAENAVDLAWAPMLEWIEAHTSFPGRSGVRVSKSD